MGIDLIDRPSPNHTDRRGQDIRLVVLHYTGMKTGEAALERMCDPDAEVSAHYMIEEDGRVFRLVKEERRAHHAGIGKWNNFPDVNSASIGIELVNPGHFWGYRDFPEAQIDALVPLLHDITGRYGLGAEAVIGHSDLAPTRKADPGELFPWSRLAAEGLAIGPWYGSEIEDDLPSFADTLTLLREIGYAFSSTFSIAPVLAFQRRFAPALIGRGLDPLTRTAIVNVHRELMAARRSQTRAAS